MSHSTPATYLVWSLLSVLVRFILPLVPLSELAMTDVILPLSCSWGYFLSIISGALIASDV
jgi:hypothetical protein